ncbi:MAG TPA: nucleotide exchange factor GrpE [Candidatus Saccharimonadales bacterium]|nr:nucleotide exchange factor GrpE [Candidatus Saccharimonadales bacterium]
MQDGIDDQQGATNPDVQALEDQIAQLTAALQRERADAVNLRRRHEEQVGSLSAGAKAQVVRALLPVVDNFERALKHVPKDLEKNDYIKGVQGVVRQFEKALADLGVQKIKAVGEPFDPHLHEAVSMEDGDGEDEIVSEELQSGYILGDDVIRHAMVRVSTK